MKFGIVDGIEKIARIDARRSARLRSAGFRDLRAQGAPGSRPRARLRPAPGARNGRGDGHERHSWWYFYMMLEAKAVNEALGIDIPAEMVDKRLEAAGSIAGHKMSMLQDLERGRAAGLYAPLGGEPAGAAPRDPTSRHFAT